MNTLEQVMETLATYSKHGWRLKRLLLAPDVRALVTESEREIFEDAVVEDASINALWFARPSHAGREA